MSNVQTRDHALLRQLAAGMRASQALYVATTLNVADHLAHMPMTSAELGTATGADPHCLQRVMRALCAVGVFNESITGRFSLNSTSALLRDGELNSFRSAILFLLGDVRWRCWSQLLETVRSGGEAAERVFGMSLFDFYAANPRESAIHDEAMRNISSTQVAGIVSAMDFSQAGVIVDVGGGTGELLAGILRANPTLCGVLYDLPHVVARAPDVLDQAGVANRVEIIGGSFFETVPSKGDTYILKTVLHDWDDARARTILGNCRNVMKDKNRLLILERELPEFGLADSMPETFLLDLEMLVMTPGGRERTRDEFARLLSDARLRLVKSTAAAPPMSVLEAHAM